MEISLVNTNAKFGTLPVFIVVLPAIIEAILFLHFLPGSCVTLGHTGLFVQTGQRQ